MLEGLQSKMIFTSIERAFYATLRQSLHARRLEEKDRKESRERVAKYAVDYC